MDLVNAIVVLKPLNLPSPSPGCNCCEFICREFCGGVFTGTGFADNLVFDEEFGGYMVGIGAKVSSPFSPLHLSLQVQTVV